MAKWNIRPEVEALWNASPAMLEALEDAEAALMNAIHLHGESPPWVFALGQVRAAIAKATGEAE